PANAAGKFTDAAQTVTYVYEKADGAPVTVNYVDGEGNELAAPQTLTGKYGETFTALAKEISGYILSDSQVKSDLLRAVSGTTSTASTVTGTFTGISQTVTFTYEKVKEVLPVEPTQPQGPTTPVKSDPILSTPTDPIQPDLVVTDLKVGVQVIKAEDPASSLPKTGDQTNRSLLGMGGLFLLLGGYLLYRTRREKKEN
uniref:MucBP domain-containing protein n=1 Tax=Listeria valentina TaxID=2705293 RepID=UPI00142F4E71